MQTVKTEAFEGRVVFHTRHLSLRTEARAASLFSAAKLACPDYFPDYEFQIDQAILATAATDSIEFQFQGDETAMLLEFQQFWAALEKAQKGKGDTLAAEAALIVNWRMDTHRLIWEAWLDAVNAAHRAYRDPVRLPKSMLTPEEQEALTDPDHPLPSPGSPSAGVSGSASESA